MRRSTRLIEALPNELTDSIYSTATSSSVTSMTSPTCPNPLLTLYSLPGLTGESYGPCGTPNTCYNIPASFADKAESVALGTAAGCVLYRRPKCQGVSQTVNLRTVNFLGNFNQQAESFMCDTFVIPPPSSSGSSSSTTSFISSTSMTTTSSSVTSSTSPPCPNPLLTLWAGPNRVGLSYAPCGILNVCYNIPTSFIDDAESVVLGIAPRCTLYRQPGCGGIFPRIVIADVNNLLAFRNTAESFYCDDGTGPPPFSSTTTSQTTSQTQTSVTTPSTTQTTTQTTQSSSSSQPSSSSQTTTTTSSPSSSTVSSSTVCAPLATFYPRQNYNGNPLVVPCNPGVCTNVPQRFKDTAASIRLGSATYCILYSGPGCDTPLLGHSPFVASTRLDTFGAPLISVAGLRVLGGFNNQMESYFCSNTPQPTCLANNSLCPSSLLYAGVDASILGIGLCVNLAVDAANCGACGATVS